MNGVPLPLVKMNQFALALLTALAILFSSKTMVSILLLIVFIPLVFGMKWNLIMNMTKPLVIKRLDGAEVQNVELLRFNQSLAAFMLAIGSTLLWTTSHWIGWVFVGMVTIAATVAVCGYCIGCTLYFQIKRLKHKLGNGR